MAVHQANALRSSFAQWPAVRSCTKRCAENVRNVRCVHSAEHTVNIVICQSGFGDWPGWGLTGGRVGEGESGGNQGIFMNFFINMSALSAQKRFLGEFGSGSRLYVDVVHAVQQGHKAVQVPLFGGWPVDCADELLASLAATDSNCCGDCGGLVGDRAADWNVPAPAHGKVGGAETVERPGRSPGDGERRAPL